MVAFLSALHWLTLVFWVGGMIVYSFLITPTLFQRLPKEEAGEIVSLLFPRYWVLGYVGAALALGTYLGIRYVLETPPGMDRLRLVLVVLMLGGAIVNGAVIGPRSRDVRVEMKAAATEAAAEPLRKRFGRLHGISMLVNVLVIFCGMALVVVTAVYPLRP